MARTTQLVSQHLENISSDTLEKTAARESRNATKSTEVETFTLWRSSLCDIERDCENIAQMDPLRGKPQEAIIRASFMQTYQYNMRVTSQKNPKDLYFFMAQSLRSMTEQVIFLRFMGTLPEEDKEALVGSLGAIDFAERSISQSTFFGSKRPTQAVFGYKEPKKILNLARAELKTVYAKNGISGKGSTWLIAKKVGLEEFYSYMFGGTSSLVHFSPRILFRMGFQKKGMDAPDRFSVRNFSAYYKDFDRFCGAYLFCELAPLVEKFLPDFSQSHLKYAIECSQIWIHSLKRWPELVTFEESAPWEAPIDTDFYRGRES